ncbi:glycosyltransferase [Patescibacteria group bacterium]
MKYNIICLSNQLWDFPNWTNKRHVMSRLAERGHNVLFVDPPINFGNVFLKQVQSGLWGLKRFLLHHKKSKCGAVVFTPINFLPISEVSSEKHVRRIKNIAKRNFDPNLKTILWIYHVQLKNLEKYIDNLKHDILVYDCVDNYEGFPEEKSIFRTSEFGKELVEQEKDLTQRADVVFASAPGLLEKLEKDNKNVHFTPNVGDYQRFKNVSEFKDKIPDELKQIPRPRVGMIGALDEYKFDANLVKKAAQENPKVSFVLIGPFALKDRDASLESIGLSGLGNVYYLGPKPYKDKHLYMTGFDAEMIPYQLNDYTVGGCFPVKFHDSLAAGLPVIVTDLPAYAPFEEVCYISRSPEEFSHNIRIALDEDSPKKAKARQEVAKENDWNGKVGKMLELISNTLS